jgi:NADPH:quinone reductase-like Zn-dependent oxidoreductase
MARLTLGWDAPRQPVLGMVLSGEVDAVGSDVRSFEVGDRVFGFNRHRFGTYAQYVCWPADGLLATRPVNLTDEEAAAIPYGGLLALHFLRKAGLRAGQAVLVFGASGAVGTSAVQLARHIGAQVTGVCRISGPDRIVDVSTVPRTSRVPRRRAVAAARRARSRRPGVPGPRTSHRDHPASAGDVAAVPP